MTEDTNQPTTVRTEGEVIDFANGGRVVVHWVDNDWIGYAKYYPGSDEPILKKQTRSYFEYAVRFTRDKIAEEASHG